MKTTIRLILAASILAGSGACGPAGDDGSAEGVALAGVTGSGDAIATADTSVTLRRVWEGFRVGWGADPTPDGRYVVTAAPEGVALARIDLVSGDLLPIKPTGTWAEAQEWAETAVVSPDGERVAYVYFSTDYGVRISGIDGSDERDLIPPDRFPGFYAVLEAWYGDEVLGTIWAYAEDGPRIVGISPADGSIRVIKDFGEDWRERRLETPLAVSPDGRFLTYGVRAPEGDADVVLIRREDGREVGRLEGPANDVAVAWTPGGDALLVHSDRELTEGLWRIPVQGGRIAGEAELMRGDLWGFEDIGAAGDAYFFGVRTDFPRVRVAAFDPASGELMSEPNPVGEIAEGQTRLPTWSPDGRALAYVKRGPDTRTGLDQTILVVRSLEGPEAREIPLPGKSLRRIYAWTPDERILGAGKASDGKWYAWSVDLGSGEVEILTSEDDARFTAMAGMSHDGTTLFTATPGEAEGEWILEAWDVRGGPDELSTRTIPGTLSGRPRIDVSPDGSTLALGFRDEGDGSTVLAVVPAAGGAVTELFRQEPPDGISSTTGVFWSPEGDRLFFATHGVPDDGVPPRLWTVDLSGAEPRVMEIQGAEMMARSGDFAIHPEGGRIAFVSGEPRSEIWMMTSWSGERR